MLGIGIFKKKRTTSIRVANQIASIPQARIQGREMVFNNLRQKAKLFRQFADELDRLADAEEKEFQTWLAMNNLMEDEITVR